MLHSGPPDETNESGTAASVAPDVSLGPNVYLAPFVNLYGCSIGNETRIGSFVEIGAGAVVGSRCKISSHTYICAGVRIGNGVFVGHGVTFTNDIYPKALNTDGKPAGPGEWRLVQTLVEDEASIGSGAVILAGVTIGCRSLVGAGSVVTHDVPPDTIVSGVPARLHGAKSSRRTRNSGG